MGRTNMNTSSGKWRPRYHYTPSKGWMNDPNGLIYFRRKYHLFYQYNPYSCDWGSMHWGHAVSDDLIHWDELACALKPDKEYDRDPEGGCFSGSVVIDAGKMYVFYTGTIHREGKVVQSQCLAISEDGIIFEKYNGNPIISGPPEGYGDDFRDPKVIRKDGAWFMICGGTDGKADDPSSHGVVFIYRSENLIQWEYKGVFYRDDSCSMFECPDLFQLDGKWILTASPMNRPDYAPNIYIVGRADFENYRFIPECSGFLDGGTHYYAAQTYGNGDGLLSIAWLGGWFWMPWIKDHGQLYKEGVRGILGVPRKLSLDADGRVVQELAASFPQLKGVLKDNAVIYPSGAEPFMIENTFHDCSVARIKVMEDPEEFVLFTLDFRKEELIADHSHADIHSRYGIRKMVFDNSLVNNHIKIMRDGCVITIILGDGYYYYTTILYPNQYEIHLEVESD